MKKYWFRAKRYGWGWTPASIEGWLIMFAWVVFNVWSFMHIDQSSHSGSDTLIGDALPFILSTLLFLMICYKTGEYPAWHCGDRDEDEKP